MRSLFLISFLFVFPFITRAQAIDDSTQLIVFHHGRTGLDRSTRHALDSLAVVLNARPDVRLDAILHEDVPCFPRRRSKLPGFPRINNIYNYLAARKTDSTERLRFAFGGMRNSDTVTLVVSTAPDPRVPAPHPNLRRAKPAS